MYSLFECYEVPALSSVSSDDSGTGTYFSFLFRKLLNNLISKIAILGRVPMFYYLVHIFLIHLLAVFAAIVSGYHWSDMILTTRVNKSLQLKGYGFHLSTVYIIWILVIILLFPLCKLFDKYKRFYQGKKWWLSYL